jgi:hypothetical protein
MPCTQQDEAPGRRCAIEARRSSLDPDCASAFLRLQLRRTRRGLLRSSSRCRQPALENGRETACERRGVRQLFAFDDPGLVEKEPGKFRELV